ncbi:MAG: 4-hydroxy-tetrahydrodipicolinate synthase [Gammaproteobacteria bacterium]|nr:4-hydroxy-tetrahydrodipicolinate synthase [Gammaproteobacteria bacterium]
MPQFRGSMVAIVTPMKGGVTTNAAIDWDRYAALLEFHIAEGTDAIVAVGTTGESATLDEAEHCEVIRRTVQWVGGRVPVIAGTGANSTTEAIALTQAAKDAGADACLLVTPYYNKPTQEGLYLHYKAVAEAVAIPQILYNVPGRTACDMQVDTVIRLAAVPNIIGIKEATGEVPRATRLRAACGPDFLLVSGDDATAREFILAGGDGVISVTANVAPRQMHEMCVAALAGDSTRAAELDERLAPLHQDLFCESNPIPAKWAVHAMGRAEVGIRLPLTWLTPGGQHRIRAAMAHAGIPIQI